MIKNLYFDQLKMDEDSNNFLPWSWRFQIHPAFSLQRVIVIAPSPILWCHQILLVSVAVVTNNLAKGDMICVNWAKLLASRPLSNTSLLNSCFLCLNKLGKVQTNHTHCVRRSCLMHHFRLYGLVLWIQLQLAQRWAVQTRTAKYCRINLKYYSQKVTP